MARSIPKPQPVLRPLLLHLEDCNFKLDDCAPFNSTHLKLDIRYDLYKTEFYPALPLREVDEEHQMEFNSGQLHFVCTHPDKSHSVVVVQSCPSEIIGKSSIYQVLFVSDKGHEMKQITIDTCSLDIIKEKLMERIKKEFPSPVEIYDIFDNLEFSEAFINFEPKHSQLRTTMKIGIIYVRKGQQEPQEWFGNGQGGDALTSEFWQFVNVLGQEIDLSGWKGYRGDMGQRGKTYYKNWNNRVECVYHLSCLMNPEEQRRLIGNDIAMILFMEEGNFSFNPATVLGLGSVPQIFVVVQPAENSLWRMGSFRNCTIQSYNPPSSSHPLPLDDLVELILTKLYNGLVMTNYCPPLNRLFSVPRGATLEAILSNFPEVSRKDRRERIKEFRRIREERERGRNDPISRSDNDPKYVPQKAELMKMSSRINKRFSKSVRPIKRSSPSISLSPEDPGNPCEIYCEALHSIQHAITLLQPLSEDNEGQMLNQLLFSAVGEYTLEFSSHWSLVIM
eukprot:TRINITY_DN5089_c0_g2_i10.p1 TRINITY_DN5089_c0_g2~~TRINITY_DN5089_c0_g2_i10.p1  ORF type:complete len:506 (+),score=104.90 TRINITY_DN5089_c0_g2_i10:152-1669(+)